MNFPFTSCEAKESVIVNQFGAVSGSISSCEVLISSVNTDMVLWEIFLISDDIVYGIPHRITVGFIRDGIKPLFSEVKKRSSRSSVETNRGDDQLWVISEYSVKHCDSSAKILLGAKARRNRGTSKKRIEKIKSWKWYTI